MGKSVTTEDENGFKSYDFSGEDYEIVETEVDVQGFYQSGHITNTIDGTVSSSLGMELLFLLMILAQVNRGTCRRVETN